MPSRGSASGVARARFAGRSGRNPFSDANDAISGKEKGKKKKAGKPKRKPSSSKVNTHGTASGPAGAARRARLRRNADTHKRDAAKARRNKS